MLIKVITGHPSRANTGRREIRAIKDASINVNNCRYSAVKTSKNVPFYFKKASFFFKWQNHSIIVYRNLDGTLQNLNLKPVVASVMLQH